MLQDEDVEMFLKLTTKEKVEAASQAAAAQKLLKKQVKQLEQDLEVSSSITYCSLHHIICCAQHASGMVFHVIFSNFLLRLSFAGRGPTVTQVLLAA